MAASPGACASRDALAFELLLKTGPRERELTNLEWSDLELDFPRVWYRCKKDASGKFTFRTKTGKDRWVPLEDALAQRLRPWRGNREGTDCSKSTPAGDGRPSPKMGWLLFLSISLLSFIGLVISTWCMSKPSWVVTPAGRAAVIGQNSVRL